MKISITKTSVIGPSHSHLRIPNQDAVKSKKSNGRWAVAVADGMGSRDMSHLGSKLATYLAVGSCLDTREDISDKELITEIYTKWLGELKAKNIEPNDAVTTLMVAWGNSKGEYRFIQLGDGVICNSATNHSVLEDDLFSNETTGLGISKKFSDWRIGKGRLNQSNGGLILMTDGISEDIEDHLGFCGQLVKRSQSGSPRGVKKKLKGLLLNWPTPNHTDDKTIAVVLINE
ncbi:PP2C family serine/threonine-protein phosphatase [Vibrio cholerae]|uniref:Protein phosphatase 2C domain-containing protein n=1 Tax=Vibrio cholerae TaxID=666 RepID=A0ABD7SPM1_VIBCL|nr:PP2C family serine/threonine-protein phosphatase [Vibrio cholerae]EGQ7701548.1 protein phosphatase 2C domain-containing protein [Vibrio cholerae]EGR2024193.1 protein phosphatase 2C domain-containing protein [Vibrio cholerae]EJL6360349.1 protein phosphatase 2C domain-containing protein [Vibrio cholerae]EJL6544959.1 protein phosphatase 2C domain-containing protein [Vibrio cholerae]EJV7637146.1 protein phosphatase 2C domain-containing protein [Vibrio cholerae]